MTDSPVGKRLRLRLTVLAADAGIEVKEVLKRADVSKYTWDKALAAQRGPRLVDMVKITEVLGCRIADIARDDMGLIVVENILPDTLRGKVEARLKEMGKELADLSANTGIPPYRIAIVLDAKNPGIKAVQAIAQVLELSVDQLVGAG